MSVTVSRYVSFVRAATGGAVKVADDVFAVVRGTVGPEVCAHEYDAMVPSVSLLPVPVKVTACDENAVLVLDWATAVGARLPVVQLVVVNRSRRHRRRQGT